MLILQYTQMRWDSGNRHWNGKEYTKCLQYMQMIHGRKTTLPTVRRAWIELTTGQKLNWPWVILEHGVVISVRQLKRVGNRIQWRILKIGSLK